MDVLEKMDEAIAGDEKAEGYTNGVAMVAPPEDGIRALDEQGREIVVPREEWKRNVIPGMVKQAWDDPDQLYLILLNSLNDGFAAEMSEAAARLQEIDTIPGRGSTMHGIVLMNTGRLAEAETLLASFEETHAPDASVLVNLAKVYAEKGEIDRAKATLERALALEPNHENGLGWYASMEQERGGDEAAHALLTRIAAMPNAWRPQLWLARGELNAANLAAAVGFYREALSRAPQPAPPDLMMQMSGDLGAKGHLHELIHLTGPNFVPEWHGLPVGNNLIKALADAGDLTSAEQVKASLWAQNRPDWKEGLAFWDGEIARRRLASGPPVDQGQAQQLQVGMLRIDGPLWLPPGSPARKLFHAKDPAAPRVTFLGGSAEAPEPEAGSQPQIADALGRMTRALPLFFAEQVEMRTAASGRTMVPWAVAPVSGFVVSGQRWPDQTAVEAVQVPDNVSEYVVSVHIDAEVEPWTAMLAFMRTADGTRIGELEREFSPTAPEQGLAELADEVVELLSALGPATESAAYVVPAESGFSPYLQGLEQLLSVRCAAMDGVPPQFLRGEQEILAGEIALCRAHLENVPVRLMLTATLGALERLKPESAAAVAEEVERLRREHPLGVADAQ